MKTSFCNSGLRWLWLTALIVIIDLASKQWIVHHFHLGESWSLLPVLNISYVLNPGAAFSFLADSSGWQRWLFAVIAVAIVGLLLWFMSRIQASVRLLNCAYALIIGGALGNLFDRLVHGMVVDFIDFHVKNWHFPTFNLADSAICIGAALIVIDGLFNSPQKTAEERP